MGQHCPIQALSINNVHAAEHVTQIISASRISSFGIRSMKKLTNVLEDEKSSVSTIKMKEATN
jgi:hypothetical protein